MEARISERASIPRLTLSSARSDSDLMAPLNSFSLAAAARLTRFRKSSSAMAGTRRSSGNGRSATHSARSAALHASAREFLEARANSQSWPIRLQATLSRFKIFVKTEGVFRVNHRDQTSADYDVLVDSLITPMSEAERLICLLAFASILSSPGVRALSQPSQSNYAALQARVETLCLPFLKHDDKKSKGTTLKQLIQTSDYVGVCVLVALDLDGGNQHPLYAALMDNCCNRSIVTAGHDQASRHLAMCFL